MFGYVIPLKGELKIKEYETFKAYYCGLCEVLQKKSYFSKYVLNYDMTFLAILLSSIYLEKENSEKKFCINKMRNVSIIHRNQYIEYAADMNIILGKKNLIDDYVDDKNYIALLSSKMLGMKDISEMSQEKIKVINSNLNKLKKLEKLKCSNIDEIGEAFANITSEIFSVGYDNNEKILRYLGYNIGKWIYTIDAYDDLIEDIKTNSYNPCIYNYGYNGENPYEFKDSIKENINFTLVKCMNEASKAFELLEIKKNKGLLENIIFLGMNYKTKLVIEGGKGNEKSIRSAWYKRWCIPGGNKASI